MKRKPRNTRNTRKGATRELHAEGNQKDMRPSTTCWETHRTHRKRTACEEETTKYTKYTKRRTARGEESTEHTEHTEKGLHVEGDHKILEILEKALRAGLPEVINARALILQMHSQRKKAYGKWQSHSGEFARYARYSPLCPIGDCLMCPMCPMCPISSPQEGERSEK